MPGLMISCIIVALGARYKVTSIFPTILYEQRTGNEYPEIHEQPNVDESPRASGIPTQLHRALDIRCLKAFSAYVPGQSVLSLGLRHYRDRLG
jgi:hypothetical protein